MGGALQRTAEHGALTFESNVCASRICLRPGGTGRWPGGTGRFAATSSTFAGEGAVLWSPCSEMLPRAGDVLESLLNNGRILRFLAPAHANLLLADLGSSRSKDPLAGPACTQVAQLVRSVWLSAMHGAALRPCRYEPVSFPESTSPSSPHSQLKIVDFGVKCRNLFGLRPNQAERNRNAGSGTRWGFEETCLLIRSSAHFGTQVDGFVLQIRRVNFRNFENSPQESSTTLRARAHGCSKRGLSRDGVRRGDPSTPSDASGQNPPSLHTHTTFSCPKRSQNLLRANPASPKRVRTPAGFGELGL